ncbi:MAG: ribosome maturation factor RimP [Clostridia bacterium]|nr:ribosome maturation factor RimP [Clostridia bacterium]
MAKADRTAAMTPVCQRVADEMGFELVEIALEKEPTGMYLRFYIDRPEGITLDDCEKYHRAVMPLAENLEYDFMEVSSPGIDRPLKTDRDFERNIGAQVEVRLFRALDGVKQFSGALADFDRDSLTLDTPAGPKRILRREAALVKPIVDMEGIEEVDLGE